MQKSTFMKGLAIGVIILFVGADFVPGISCIGKNVELSSNRDVSEEIPTDLEI